MLEMKMTTDLQTALPAEIGFNFDELKAELTERLHHYNTLVVTEDAIKEAKTDLANLRKLRDAIETRRKEVKKQCMEPYNAFEAQVKELTKLIDAPVAAINEQVKAFEKLEQAKKLEEIAAAYEELVQDSFWDIIPLKRILDPKWLNKGTTMKSIREEIATVANRTKIDILYIESATEPQYLTAVRAKYIETLNIDAALDHRDQLMAAERTFQHRNTQQAAPQPPVNITPPVAHQEPVTEYVTQPSRPQKLYSLRLEFHLTMDQANDLKRFLADNNIDYVKIQGGN